MKSSLLLNLKRAKKEKANRVIIYYSGHGDEDTGGWVTYKPTNLGMSGVRVTMTEILNIVKDSKFN